MKQLPSEKYNVAWFKLADCIARGEKERALGVYRLLSHSFDDPALARQLHADILRLFKDERAQDAYQEAAVLYRERNRFIEAAAVYEHLITINPTNLAYRTQLIELYQRLGITSKAVAYVQQLIDDLITQDQWEKAIEMSTHYDQVGDSTFTAHIHEQMLFYLLDKKMLSDTIMVHAKKAVDAWLRADDRQAMQLMLARLQAADEKMHEYVRDYLGK